MQARLGWLREKGHSHHAPQALRCAAGGAEDGRAWLEEDLEVCGSMAQSKGFQPVSDKIMRSQTWETHQDSEKNLEAQASNLRQATQPSLPA